MLLILLYWLYFFSRLFCPSFVGFCRVYISFILLFFLILGPLVGFTAGRGRRRQRMAPWARPRGYTAFTGRRTALLIGSSYELSWRLLFFGRVGL